MILQHDGAICSFCYLVAPELDPELLCRCSPWPHEFPLGFPVSSSPKNLEVWWLAKVWMMCVVPGDGLAFHPECRPTSVCCGIGSRSTVVKSICILVQLKKSVLFIHSVLLWMMSIFLVWMNRAFDMPCQGTFTNLPGLSCMQSSLVFSVIHITHCIDCMSNCRILMNCMLEWVFLSFCFFLPQILQHVYPEDPRSWDFWLTWKPHSWGRSLY